MGVPDDAVHWIPLNAVQHTHTQHNINILFGPRSAMGYCSDGASLLSAGSDPALQKWPGVRAQL